MIDAETIAQGFFTAAAAARSRTDAARALDALGAALRASLHRPSPAGAPAPRMRLVALPPLTPEAGPAAAAERLRLRADEVRLAMQFGTGADVDRVIGLTVAELRQAALGSIG